MNVSMKTCALSGVVHDCDTAMYIAYIGVNLVTGADANANEAVMEELKGGGGDVTCLTPSQNRRARRPCQRAGQIGSAGGRVTPPPPVLPGAQHPLEQSPGSVCLCMTCSSSKSQTTGLKVRQQALTKT